MRLSDQQVVIRTSSSNEAYEVYIQYEIHPNETHYDFKDTIPREDMSMFESVTDPLEYDELKHTFTVPLELTSMNGSYLVGVKLKRNTISFKEISISKYN